MTLDDCVVNGVQTRRTQDSSDPRHFGTVRLVPRCPDISAPVPKCPGDRWCQRLALSCARCYLVSRCLILGAKLSVCKTLWHYYLYIRTVWHWCWNVLGPNCPGSKVSFILQSFCHVDDCV